MNYSAEKLLAKQLLKAIPKLASLAQRARQITYVHNNEALRFYFGGVPRPRRECGKLS